VRSIEPGEFPEWERKRQTKIRQEVLFGGPGT